MSNKNTKINWLNIIVINEFQNLLDIQSLKELSLVSKLARKKSENILFEYIALSGNKFNFIDSTEYYDFFIELFFSPLKSIMSAEIESLRKRLNIQQEISDINRSLIGIKKFAKSFYLEEVGRAGFYLFPTVYNLNNLTVLNLRSCVISFSEISNIGQTLPNLREICLYCVYLIKSPSDISSREVFVFPSNLYLLDIYCCKVINNAVLSDPYEFLFSKEFTQAAHNDFKLPPISVPSLKNLYIFYNNLVERDLREFLEYNPNLEVLNIEYFYSNLISSINSINSLEFRYLTRFDSSISYFPINSITRLKINVVNTNYYDSIKKLCSLLPNLEYLYFNFSYGDTFQTSIDNFIEPVLSNLFKSKTLELVINESWPVDSDIDDEDDIQDNLISIESIDLAKFSSINTLILECDSSTLCNLNFNNCKTLKRVKLLANDEVNLFKFKDKFDSYKNWKFNFSEYIARGYKL
ncbi:hypothetical protein CONCODRAFT_168199 [Conidiobolus coronatus NRRL 28638]|uniref:F-box domain-containing protein n=1 Tax=Conidiobolus coronatus (strain ATCC 28846 / CBS 209.66 / NRRL 28638) TaxID=796925 RepID=A0A137NVQ8_CONC2|nr:hypothetical protein CONCODRAFT_168199 [Conidiobolus coronatus NRRL 28638]|eukprot:KXN66684.1 hypothetical protein CONCODRAFT_168199 [Conidiobolus coronatus NRRL 28638]